MADNYEVTIRLTGQNQMSGAVNAANRDIDRLATNTRSAGQASTAMSRSMTQGLNQARVAIAGFATAFIGSRLLQAVGDLSDLGQEARTAANTFEALAGGSDQAAAALGMLRTSTRGIVDDMTLMQGANKFLLMGLADSTEQAAKLSEAAVTMGRAMGMDAGAALGDFAALLANQSIPRLDNFGISSDRVRQRLEELKAAGMGAQEAFASAVLAEYEANLDKLGDSIEENVSKVDVLKVRLDNVVQNIGEGVFNIVNEAANTLNMVIEMADAAGGRMAWQSDRNRRAQPYLEAMGANRATITFFGQPVYETNLYRDATPEAQALATTLVMYDEVDQARRRAARQAYAYFQQQRVDQEELVRLEQERARQQEIVNQNTSAFYRVYHEIAGTARAVRGRAGDTLLFSREEAEQALATISDLEYGMGLLEGFSEDGLISETDLQMYQRMFEQTQAWADEMERGAQAFENMNLRQLLGEGGGGIAGEITDDVLEMMRDSGMSEEQLEEFQRAFGLGTGRITEASLIYRDEVLPMLVSVAEQYGPEEAINALNRWLAGSQNSLLAGQANYGAYQTGYVRTGGGGSQVVVRPGDTLSGLAAQTGMSIQDLMRITGTTDPRLLQPGTYGGGGGGIMSLNDSPLIGPLMGAGGIAGITSLSEIQEYQRNIAVDAEDAAAGMTKFADEADRAKSVINSLTNRVNEVTLKLNVIDPAGLLKLLNLEGLLSLVGGATRDNGGLVPGATLRAGRTAATT